MNTKTSTADSYLRHFRGSFLNMLRWPQLSSLWQTLRQQTNNEWYAYAVGETPPDRPLNPSQLDAFITEIDTLLRKEHDEDYCGIVYVDNPETPQFIKIYDPHNLGVVCGFSDQPPLPAWTLSLLPPCDLPSAFPPPAARRRWWQRIIG